MTGLAEPADEAISKRNHVVHGMFVRECTLVAGPRRDVAVLFVHGGMHGWWTWQRWQRVFAHAGWRTFAMSLPGHPDSRPLSEDEAAAIRLADYTTAVTEIVDWLDRPVVLVGHSMGGNIIQHVAQRRPATALVLMSPIGPLGTPVRPPVPDGPYWLGPDEARAAFFYEIDDESFAEIYRLLVPEPGTVLNDYPRGGRIAGAAIDVPVLVLVGEHDRPVFQQHARESAQFYDAALMRIAGAGHDLMLESHAEHAARQVIGWLELVIDPKPG